MTKKTLSIVTVIAALVTLSFAQAQPQPQYANRAGRLHTFDVSTAVEISGVIAKVENCNLGTGQYANGINLTVDDGKQQAIVRLGPIAYLNDNNWTFKQGDKIIVKAFNGTGDFAGEFFASEVILGGKSLLLRDRYGLPLWRQSLRGGRGMGPGRGYGRGMGYGRGRGYGRGMGCGRGMGYGRGGGYGRRY